jgi:hypothetical protein
VVAELSKNPALRVERKRGRVGELRVAVDGKDVYEAAFPGYPTPASVVKRIERYLSADAA